jgi:PhnB protein
MQIHPYVFFDGRCDEALRFYTEKLGAQVLFRMQYKDAPPEAQSAADPKVAEQIMHASLQIGTSILMCSDDCMNPGVTHSGFSLSLHADSVADGERLFNALAEGGNVFMPWQPTFWSKGFGMVTDRFGIRWMVTLAEGA